MLSESKTIVPVRKFWKFETEEKNNFRIEIETLFLDSISRKFETRTCLIHNSAIFKKHIFVYLPCVEQEWNILFLIDWAPEARVVFRPQSEFHRFVSWKRMSFDKIPSHYMSEVLQCRHICSFTSHVTSKILYVVPFPLSLRLKIRKWRQYTWWFRSDNRPIGNWVWILTQLPNVRMKRSVVWDIEPRNPLKINCYFRGICRCHFQGRIIIEARN
jgi:hypothetical protein